MADRYWVGGSGTWDASTTTRWSATSGGSTGASAPTSADNVFFDANSNVGTGSFTVTVSTTRGVAVCKNITISGLDGSMTLALGSSNVTVYGSWTNPATGFAFTGSVTGSAIIDQNAVVFAATTAGNTITTNGYTWPAGTNILFSGAGGGWTLNGALATTESTNSGYIRLIQGTLDTTASNYSLSGARLYSTGSLSRTLTLNGSTVTLTSSNTTVSFSGSNFTFNAGTSTIVCSSSAPFIAGASKTFNNITVSSSTVDSLSVTGANTFNNITFAAPSGAWQGYRRLFFDSNQTISGTLNFGMVGINYQRVYIYNSPRGSVITLTVNAVANATDIDFQGITIAGASSPWSGTRFGDGGGNSGVTFPAAKTVYWNLAAGGNFATATAWALTSGGAPSLNNFPLLQDTAIVEDTGLNTNASIFFDDFNSTNAWKVGTLDASSRTLAWKINGDTTFSGFTVYGDLILSSAVTIDYSDPAVSTAYLNFYGWSKTQTFNGAGETFTGLTQFNILSVFGSVDLAANATMPEATINLDNGTLNLNSYTLSADRMYADNIDTVGGAKTLAFGTGAITLTGVDSGTIDVLNLGTSTTDLLFTGTTKTITSTNSSTTVARTFITPLFSESNTFNLTVTGGSYRVYLEGAYKNITLSGFTGTFYLNEAINCYGNFAVGSITAFSGAFPLSFLATSGTQTINLNNISFPNAITFGGSGTAATTFSLSAAMTVVGAVTFANGTLKLASGTTNTVGSFATSGTTLKYLQATTAGSQATLSDASGTNSATYLSIKDSVATGGATFNALLSNLNVNAGNNTGWNFGQGGFLVFFI